MTAMQTRPAVQLTQVVAGVRTALYMATVVATRHNPVIRNHFKQLRQRGKSFKLALTACMRKLLTILNSILKNKTPWRNNLLETA